MMEVSNASTFAGATRIPYATAMPWTLVPNLGTETVYVQFWSVNGTLVGTAQASINLVSAGSSASTSPSASSTSQSPASASLIAELANLEAQLTALQARANQQGASSPAHFVFTRNLSLWNTGNDVKQLQLFLIAQASGPAAAKLAKHGATNLFGTLTFNALVEFQKKAGIKPASGYFGPKTRAYVNGLPR
jgi:murein L,D-transpeptidase YcbB/YkuD